MMAQRSLRDRARSALSPARIAAFSAQSRSAAMRQNELTEGAGLRVVASAPERRQVSIITSVYRRSDTSAASVSVEWPTVKMGWPCGRVMIGVS